MTPDKPNRNPARTPTESAQMETAELLELAVIDAFGMLDDEDRAEFDRAFSACPATLQELIRAEQERVVESIDFLPEVEPGGRLKARTMARIRDEIEASLPIAAAGGVSRAVSHVAHDRSPADADLRPPRFRRAPRVNHRWRVAAVAMSVALVVIAALHVQLRQQIDTVREQGRMANFIDSIGIGHIETALFSDDASRFHFQPVGDSGKARATFMFDPQTDTARLYVLGLSTQGNYKLVTLDANGQPDEVLRSFSPSGVLSGFDVNIERAGQVRLAIITDDGQAEVLFVADVRFA